MDNHSRSDIWEFTAEFIGGDNFEDNNVYWHQKDRYATNAGLSYLYININRHFSYLYYRRVVNNEKLEIIISKYF